MTHIWTVVHSRQKVIIVTQLRGFRRKQVQKTVTDREVISRHDSEEEANEAARQHPGATVERERIRLDIDG